MIGVEGVDGITSSLRRRYERAKSGGKGDVRLEFADSPTTSPLSATKASASARLIAALTFSSSESASAPGYEGGKRSIGR